MLAKFLKGTDAAKFAMAGYRLSNTLSEHGTVTRGICGTNAAHHLISMRNARGSNMRWARFFKRKAKEETFFTGDEAASMNFWGLYPGGVSAAGDPADYFPRKERQRSQGGILYSVGDG